MFFVLLLAIRFLSLLSLSLTVYLSSVRLSFSLFRLVLVWYWHRWQRLWKWYGIKDINKIKTFLKANKSLYRDIYCHRDIKCHIVISDFGHILINMTEVSEDSPSAGVIGVRQNLPRCVRVVLTEKPGQTKKPVNAWGKQWSVVFS